MTAPVATPPAAKNERRGPVLDVLKELLTGGHTDAVIALVAKLVARNSELERKLADVMSRGHKNEGVSTAQLLLMLEELAAVPVEDLDAANRQLRQASGIDEKKDEAAVETETPRRQPPLRRPVPPELHRAPRHAREARVWPVRRGDRPCAGR